MNIFDKNSSSSNSNSNLTSSNTTKTKTGDLKINDVIKIFEENGYTITLEEQKPFFSMIGAKDGVMFYIDDSPVKIYEYSSKKSYTEAVEQFSILENMPVKGLVVLDTNLSSLIEIFNNI